MTSFEDVETVRHELSRMTFDYWGNHSLFTWQWFLLVILVIAPWPVWWRLVHKRRLVEITLFGTIIAIMTTLMDLVGMNLGLWGYSREIVWFLVPPVIPIDLCLLPLEHMLTYQYFPKWKHYMWAIAAVGAFDAFIAEPMTVWIHIYVLYHWRYVYSLPIYMLKAVVAKWLIGRLLQVSGISKPIRHLDEV